MKYLLAFTWELPQTLVGLCLYFFLDLRSEMIFSNHPLPGTVLIYHTEGSWSCCLGRFIFCGMHSTAFTLYHEYGHSRQSKRLGWLYLPIIGIPSAARFALLTMGIIDQKKYYQGYPEKWASTLGGWKWREK